MKTKDLLEELESIAKNSGITIRRETGNFRSGNAILKEQKLIIINKTATPEIAARVIARGLPEDVLSHSFLKPVVREFIEKELTEPAKSNFNLVVQY